jgi:hypothetical protein
MTAGPGVSAKQEGADQRRGIRRFFAASFRKRAMKDEKLRFFHREVTDDVFL